MKFWKIIRIESKPVVARGQGGEHSGRRELTAKGMKELFEEMVMFYSIIVMVVL